MDYRAIGLRRLYEHRVEKFFKTQHKVIYTPITTAPCQKSIEIARLQEENRQLKQKLEAKRRKISSIREVEDKLAIHAEYTLDVRQGDFKVKILCEKIEELTQEIHELKQKNVPNQCRQQIEQYNNILKMITPRFTLDQDDTFVYVDIRTPYVKISEAEFYIEERDFKFYLKPYLLQLTLPDSVIEDGRESASYDVDAGIIKCKVPKMTAGANFEGLDMIATLLNPKKKDQSNKIEVVEGNEYTEIAEDLEDSQKMYGFNRQYINFFDDLQEQLLELTDFSPEGLDPSERFLQKFTRENEDFDIERYLIDADDPYIDSFSIPTWDEVFSGYKISLEEQMSDLQLDSLIRLGNKDYLINSNLDIVIKMQLFDIICAFWYDLRTTGDHTCESAWTINKLAAALSCFVEYATLEEVAVSFTRRVLIYPLYRTMDLAKDAINDARMIFMEGRKAVLKVLIKIKELFDSSEPRYLMNRLFIDDLAIWLQKVETFDFFAKEVNRVEVPDIENLDLPFE